MKTGLATSPAAEGGHRPGERVPRFFLLEALLRLFPCRFRHAFGAEMRAHFAARHRLARGAGRRAVIALWARTAPDLLLSALRERRQSSLDPTTIPTRPAARPAATGDTMLSVLIYDLRQAARSLWLRPGFTGLVVFTLALGIGANTAIFSVVDAVLLRPLPYDEPEELVRIHGRFDPESGFDFAQFPLAEPELIDYRESTRALSAVGGYWVSTRALSGGDGEPERVPAAGLTAEILPLLGAEPVAGRGIAPEEVAPGADPVVLLSWATWQQRFGGDPSIVGRDIRLSGAPTRVVGVMGPDFLFPDPDIRVWVPFIIDPANLGGRSSHYLSAVGRLAPGVGIAQAEEEMRALMAGWQEEYPAIHTGHYLYLRPLLEDTVGDVRPALLTLLAASGFVLLLACVNIAGVLTARGEERVREVALRTAVGAGRGRIVGLLMGESLLLALIGGTLGVGVAAFALGRLVDLQAGGIPRPHAVTLDARILAFAALATFATAVLFGLVPALRVSGASPQLALREGARGATGRGIGRALLVVAEVALCFVLVLGAGLMLRSLDRLLEVDKGFDPSGRVVGRVALASQTYANELVDATFERIAARLQAQPGVERVAMSGAVPLLNGWGIWDFQVEGATPPSQGEVAWNAGFDAISPGFFDTLGMRILAGRDIEPADTADSEPVAVVNQAFAERYFPGRSPLGERIRVSGSAWQFMRIVGVVEDARYDRLADAAYPRYYAALTQWAGSMSTPPRTRYLSVRTAGDPAAAIRAVRATVHEIDPELPVYELQSLDAAISASAARPRFTGLLLSLFAGLALVLGASGTYGVLAYAVARRSRELGIRKALGASPGQTIGLVMVHGLIPVGAGLAIGAVVALFGGRVLESQLFGVTVTDPLVWGAVLVVLIAMALVAIAVPAARAFRLDPVDALRAD